MSDAIGSSWRGVSWLRPLKKLPRGFTQVVVSRSVEVLMSSDVDAVIAALRIVLQEAERRTWTSTWEIHTVNRWIGQLPGAWAGRWRRLRLKPSYSGGGTAYREEFLTHVRATLAYLETNRDVIAAQRSLWLFGKAERQAAAKRNEVA